MPDGELDRMHDLAANGPPALAATARKFLTAGPAVDAAYAFYWQAWHELSTERPGGMGLSPIPLSAVWRMSDRLGLSKMDCQIFEQVIRLVDGNYLSKRAEKQRKESK